MAALPKNPSRQAWLQDFRAILALTPVMEEGVRGLVYSRYPDAGWADEYWCSLWSAYLYLRKNQNEWEKLGLAVVGRDQGILKDSLLLALYTPFLSCPLESIHTADFPVTDIAGKAHELEKRFGSGAAGPGLGG